MKQRENKSEEHKIMKTKEKKRNKNRKDKIAYMYDYFLSLPF